MTQALIIVFREAFESFLIVAITLAYLKKTGRDSLRPAIWWAVGLSVIASFALGYWLQQISNPLWEGVLAIVAAALVISLLIHLRRTGHRLTQQIESGIENRVADRPTMLAWLGVFGFTFLMVTREGMETALMLIQVRQSRFWLGCALGLAAAAVLASLWARFGHRINIKRFFQVTSLFLLLFSAQVLLYGIHELSEAEVLPASDTIHTLTEAYSADGRYSLYVFLAIIGVCAIWLAAAKLFDRAAGHAQLPATNE